MSRAYTHPDDWALRVEKPLASITLRSGRKPPPSRLARWGCTSMFLAIVAVFPVDALLDGEIGWGRRATVLAGGVVAGAAIIVALTLIFKPQLLEATFFADRLVLAGPPFRHPLEVPMDNVDFVAVDDPDRAFEQMGLRQPPRFPVSWAHHHVRGTGGQSLAPLGPNFVVVFATPVEFPPPPPFVMGIARRGVALFGSVLDGKAVATELEGAVTVRELETKDAPRLSIEDNGRAWAVVRNALVALVALVVLLAPTFALAAYYHTGPLITRLDR